MGRKAPVTMQNVARTLGVNVSTLYRHVGGIDELRRIWANVASPTVQGLPAGEGESWREWLRSLARHYREALRGDPDLFEFAQAALDPNFESLEQATRILVDFGFEPRAAAFSHGFLMNTVIGFVHQELRMERDQDRGTHAYASLFRALRDNPDGLSHLRSVGFSPKDFDADATFDLFLQLTIEGIAAMPGAPPEGQPPLMKDTIDEGH